MVTDAGTEPPNLPPPPPRPPDADDDRRVGRFVRRPDLGPLGGVCAGIAEHLRVDATLVRIGAVVLALLGPGIPAYVVAWIFLPEADGTTVAPRLGRAERDDRMTQAVGIALIIVALSVLWGDWWFLGRGWFLPLGLIGLGAWLLLRSSQDDDAPPVAPVPPVPPGPPAPPNAPAALSSAAPGATAPTVTVDAPGDGEGGSGAAAGDRPPDEPSAGTEPEDGPDADATLVDTATGGGEPPDGGSGTAFAAAPEPPAPPARAASRRRGRMLGPLVFGVLLVWAGVAWLAGVDAEDGLAVGLCLVGVGFVAGAFVGGSRALIAPALVLAAALATATVVDIPFGGGVGDRHWSVSTVRDLDDEYRLGVGEATLDLRDLRLARGRVPEVTVHVGIGRLEVIVPEGAALDVHAEAGAGEIDVLGHRDDGLGVDFDRRIDGDEGAGGLELDLQVGIGQIEVREAPRAASGR